MQAAGYAEKVRNRLLACEIIAGSFQFRQFNLPLLAQHVQQVRFCLLLVGVGANGVEFYAVAGRKQYAFLSYLARCLEELRYLAKGTGKSLAQCNGCRAVIDTNNNDTHANLVILN